METTACAHGIEIKDSFTAITVLFLSAEKSNPRRLGPPPTIQTLSRDRDGMLAWTTAAAFDCGCDVVNIAVVLLVWLSGQIRFVAVFIPLFRWYLIYLPHAIQSQERMRRKFVDGYIVADIEMPTGYIDSAPLGYAESTAGC